MKLELILNLGNYENIKIVTNEHESTVNCYAEIQGFLSDWTNYTDNAKKLLEHISKITKTNSVLNIFPEKKHNLTPAEEASLRKIEQEWKGDEDDSLKVSKDIKEIFMDLTEVTIEAFTEKALLVTKKGYQKWVPKSVVDPQVDLSQLEKGQYYGIIPLTAKDEHWFHDKKTWEVYRVL